MKMEKKNKINKVHFLPLWHWVGKEYSFYRRQGTCGVYVTTTETCCKYKAVINNELLLEFWMIYHHCRE